MRQSILHSNRRAYVFHTHWNIYKNRWVLLPNQYLLQKWKVRYDTHNFQNSFRHQILPHTPCPLFLHWMLLKHTRSYFWWTWWLCKHYPHWLCTWLERRIPSGCFVAMPNTHHRHVILLLGRLLCWPVVTHRLWKLAKMLAWWNPSESPTSTAGSWSSSWTSQDSSTSRSATRYNFTASAVEEGPQHNADTGQHTPTCDRSQFVSPKRKSSNMQCIPKHLKAFLKTKTKREDVTSKTSDILLNV